ncbi:MULTISPECIES: hypothetical protein [Streptomyces]|uniref:Uncharacterized protein n=1 Tax=Streptomyces griseosporeus TaxID=1910 RepID=A0ABV3L3Y1_STRGS|nr:hypothetical protein [Streptomyces actuosus]MBM4826616.1 hypothetical protein [Streptomyces actuosus]
MNQRGFRYSSPLQTANRFRGGGKESLRQEKATAVAEAECARSSGFSATAARLGSTKSTSELSMAYGKDLALAEALRKKAVPQARVILEGAAAAGTETPAASLLDK